MTAPIAGAQFRSNWLVDPVTGAYSAYIPSPTGIPADPALTSHGVSQARELGRHLVDLDPPVEAVYSSPFYRCLQTLGPFMRLRLQKQQHDRSASGPAAGDDGVAASIRLEHGIREWFGSAPFSHPQPADTTVLKSLFPAIDEDYVPIVVPSPRGETLAQLQERVALALRGIVEQCDAQGVRSALLCTHAAVVIVLGRILTGHVPDSIDAEDFCAYTCGLSVFHRGEGGRSEASLPADSSGRSSQHVLPNCWPTESTSHVIPSVLTKRLADLTAGLIGGWRCELDSDCSFLSGGQERGWYVPTPAPCRCSSSRHSAFRMSSSPTPFEALAAREWYFTSARGSLANTSTRRFAGDESFPGPGSLSPGDAESKL